MNRRQLLQRALTAAAAAVVAPAVRAEAAKESEPSSLPTARERAIWEHAREINRWACYHEPPYSGIGHSVQAFNEDWTITQRLAAEQERRATLSAWEGPMWAADGSPLTFEAMQAECAARGCSTHTAVNLDGSFIVVHGQPGILAPWATLGPLERFRGPLSPTDLARVDAWRLSLHEQT